MAAATQASSARRSVLTSRFLRAANDLRSGNSGVAGIRPGHLGRPAARSVAMPMLGNISRWPVLPGGAVPTFGLPTWSQALQPSRG